VSEIIKQDPVPALPGAVTEAESRTIVDVLNTLDVIHRYGFEGLGLPSVTFKATPYTFNGRAGIMVGGVRQPNLAFFVSKFLLDGDYYYWEILRFVDGQVQPSVWPVDSLRSLKSTIVEVDDAEVVAYQLQSFFFYEDMVDAGKSITYGDERDPDAAGGWVYLSHPNKRDYPFVGCMPPLSALIQVQVRLAPSRIDVFYGIMGGYHKATLSEEGAINPTMGRHEYGVLIFPDQDLREPKMFDMRMVKAWRMVMDVEPNGNQVPHSIVDLVNYVQKRKASHKVITNG